MTPSFTDLIDDYLSAYFRGPGARGIVEARQALNEYMKRLEK